MSARRLRAATIGLALVASLGGCRGPAPPPAATSPTMPIADIIAREAEALMKIEGVVGVAQGETRGHAPCIKILVAKRTPALAARLPERIEGVPVEIEETGVIRPMGER